MLPIIIDEPHFLVVNKPAGLFSQAAEGIDSVQSVITQQLKERDSHPGTPFVGLPHRLDRDTSGVMLLARNQRALKRFGEQFHSRKVAKFYVAVLEASDRELHPGEWNDYVRKIPDVPKAEVCVESDTGAKAARLRIWPIAASPGKQLALIQLHTGRMHQIRVQAAARQMPILGDETYGAQMPTVGPMALHALRLEFRHPQTAKLTTATAQLPATEPWCNLDPTLAEQLHRQISLSRAQQGAFDFAGWDQRR